ncbi:hypothetical protein A9978_18865 [Pseudomonas sp. UMC65]|uniref:hypothetical protein n=1 Tax=Pseudomonas sp. UMC65 TaxID=1862323 RepID=UPI001603FDA3|nr:hypothetical protein [Pseudomonas sp. UMC65]MBB1614502.1 hypothetical protein [Pseudomonas sp. UMC65]
MHTQNDSSNSPPSVATRFADSENVSHVQNFHQSAAMYAARMVRFQYTRDSKIKFQRECLDHLKASLNKAKGSAA